MRGDEPLDLSVQFVGLPSGMYNVGVSLMSDYWIGVDAKVSCMMKVLKPTATNVAAREAKSASRSDVTKPNAEVEEEESSESDYSDDDEDDYSDEDYPSDETGTSESDDEARARIDAMRRPEQTKNTVKEGATAAKPASVPQRKTSTFDTTLPRFNWLGQKSYGLAANASRDGDGCRCICEFWT